MSEFLMISITIGISLVIYGHLKQDLYETENKYEALANSSQDLIYTVNLQGEIQMVNALFKQKFAMEFEPIVSKHIGRFFQDTMFSWVMRFIW